jgi:hypothetical protein
MSFVSKLRAGVVIASSSQLDKFCQPYEPSATSAMAARVALDQRPGRTVIIDLMGCAQAASPE